MKSSNRRTASRARGVAVSVLATVLSAGLGVTAATSSQAATTDPQPPEPSSSRLEPTVKESTRNDTSAPLTDLAEASDDSTRRSTGEIAQLPTLQLPKASTGLRAASQAGSEAVGESAPTGLMPEFDADFEGIDNVNGVFPPDPDGAVGPNHYMQMVNISLAVWDKDGNLLLGPVDNNTLWDGFGGACENTNFGDPIVLYDHLADRWMASQFAWENNGPFFECIAVSQTGDPTGAWHRYAFLISNNKLNDYPKLGVWPDAYYMAVNQFIQPGSAWGGQGAVAFERDAMIAGEPAQMVYFDLGPINDIYGGQLPADLDGAPPPAGTPNYFVEMDDDAFGFDTDRLSVWEFHVDWDNPANSTYGINGEPNYHIDTAEFDANMCGFNRACIPQPDTTSALDAISDRLMWRLQYRNFGDYATMVVNHTVDVDGTDHAGIRWYELRDTGGGWGIHQQGTYAPDEENRWMGSAAMDVSGNIAIGYSVASESTYPSIRVAGRLAGDPLGELSQGESEMIAGTGSQTDVRARWGDYSRMQVDPVDGCTFWYTSEYYETTSPAGWQTRIGHFKFPSCTAGPAGTLSGVVTDASTGAPIDGATVTTGQFSTTTDDDGTYSLTIPPGTYDMTVSAFGYQDGVAQGVVVTDGTTTEQNFALEPQPTVILSGTIADSSGHGWPLNAQVTVDGVPGGTTYTNPFNGQYQIELPANSTYSVTVGSLYPGYQTVTEDVVVGASDVTHDVAVPIDAQACNAPGYQYNLGEDFNEGELPEGWTIVDYAGTGEVWQFNDPGGRGNDTGGDGAFAIVDSDEYGSSGRQDTDLVSPVFDLSDVAEPTLTFKQDFNWYSPTPDEEADVDISIDGGQTWQNVLHQVGDDVPGPDTQEIPIPQAGGEPDVQVRFHYGPAEFEFWWQVDDVFVGECAVRDGGLVAGNVADANTGGFLNGATVTSVDRPTESTSTFSPDNPRLDDGFYWMFSSLTGEHPFRASLDSYVDQTAQAAVAADGIVRRDFALGAGVLTVEPTSLDATMRLGRDTTRSFTVTNEGTAPVDVELAEGGSGFEMLGSEGAGNHGVINHVTGPATVPDAPGGGDTNRPIPRDTFATDANAEKPGHSATPVPEPTNPDEITITHSASQDIVSGNSVACSPDNGATTTDNQYLRTFTLDDFDIGGDFNVTEVSFGVEAATAQTLTVNLYTLEGDLLYENLTPIGSTEQAIDAQELSLVTVPVTGTAPAGSTLVVEVVSPDLSSSGRLFIGSNDAGQTAPSYLASASCEIPEPIDTEEVSPGMHIVMNVTGEVGGDVPWMSVDPLTFTLDPGESTQVNVGMDGRVDQPGTYTGSINIGHDTPYDVPDVDVTMTIEPPKKWGKITGQVTGTSCEGATAALEDAIVHVNGDKFDVTLLTDESGQYAYWLDVSNNPLELVVSANDHIPQTRQARIIPRQTAVENFALTEFCT